MKQYNTVQVNTCCNADINQIETELSYLSCIAKALSKNNNKM